MLGVDVFRIVSLLQNANFGFKSDSFKKIKSFSLDLVRIQYNIFSFFL